MTHDPAPPPSKFPIGYPPRSIDAFSLTGREKHKNMYPLQASIAKRNKTKNMHIHAYHTLYIYMVSYRHLGIRNITNRPKTRNRPTPKHCLLSLSLSSDRARSPIPFHSIPFHSIPFQRKAKVRKASSSLRKTTAALNLSRDRYNHPPHPELCINTSSPLRQTTAAFSLSRHI